jgi:hypothetical protein
MLYEAANALIPIKMCASTVEFDQFTPGWTLSQIESELDPFRTFAHRVQFDTPFSNTPLVHVGLLGFDIDNRDSARINVHTEAITSSTFDIVIKTWRNTRVYNVQISWIALGQA